MIGADGEKEFSWLRRSIIKFFCTLAPRIILALAGFYTFKTYQLLLSDIDPTYPRIQLLKNQNRRACIVVSNHISWVDIFTHMIVSDSPSFLSKKEIASYPCVGLIATSMQSLFVERDSRDQKDAILGLIKHRVEQIEAGKNFPQVLIFPEGTTSNGEYIISFKKGAFASFAPIKIRCLRYTNPRFNPSLDALGTGLTLLLTFCQISNGLTIYEFDTFYPDYLKLSTEDDWKVYAEKIKNIMVKALGCKSSEMGLTDKNNYEKILKESKKQKI